MACFVAASVSKSFGISILIPQLPPPLSCFVHGTQLVHFIRLPDNYIKSASFNSLTKVNQKRHTLRKRSMKTFDPVFYWSVSITAHCSTSQAINVRVVIRRVKTIVKTKGENIEMVSE